MAEKEEEPKKGNSPPPKKKPKFRDSDEGREFECVLCDCKFFTVAQYTVHIQSFEHRKRTVQKAADKAYDRAPQYQGGREKDLPSGLSGRKVVHCKVCNVFTNSPKQLAEHLNGGRHKQLCFKFNVPVTTLVLTKEDRHTLDSTRLHGEKLLCKYCSVELNSMQQYKEHMNSTKHKLRVENKPVRPERAMKRALKALFKKQKKKPEDDERTKKEKKRKEEGEDKGSDGEKSQEGNGESHKEKAEEEDKKGTSGSGSDISKVKFLLRPSLCGDGAAQSSPQHMRVRNKYQLNLLDELNETPTLRNEIHYYRAHRPPKEKKPPKVKPVPFMCDVCQVFTKSACELNEHLTSEDHHAALKKFLEGGKSAIASSADGKPPLKVEDNHEAEGTEEPLGKKPELYCDACQLLLPSLGHKREHEKSKKHKFLQELRKGMKTEPKENATAARRGGSGDRKEETKPEELAAPKGIHCSLCMVDVESEAAMKEHLKSKKHKFLSELKPDPEPVRRPEPALKRKRPWPHSGSDSGRRELARDDVMPELAAVALERQALQVELAKRRREIDEQRRLIDEMREEHHLEQEKAALRRMIDECRQLIEERDRRKRRAAEDRDRAHKSVRWHPSLESDYCQDGGGGSSNSSSSMHDYRLFSTATRWNEEIPLLGMPSAASEEPVWEADRKPVFQAPPVAPEAPFWEADRKPAFQVSSVAPEAPIWEDDRKPVFQVSPVAPEAPIWEVDRKPVFQVSPVAPEAPVWEADRKPVFQVSPVTPEAAFWEADRKPFFQNSPVAPEVPIWEADRRPVSQQPFGHMATAFSNNGWPSPSEEHDWQRPVLCTPPARAVGFRGDRPEEPHLWGAHSAPTPDTPSWSSSTTRIPGLDFV